MIEDNKGNKFSSIAKMAEFYNMSPSTLSHRLQKMSVEDALNKTLRKTERSGCYDHLGNRFPSKTAMCKHYGIDKSMFFGRIAIGWSLEDALTAPLQTSPPNTKEVTDHEGTVFPSVSDMCAYWKIGRSTFNARIKSGWSIKDALTHKAACVNIKTKTCVDHLGKQYASQNEMCKAYGISKDMYLSRIKLGWTTEKALTSPIVINAKECADGFGNTFPSAKDICNYYRLPITYVQGKHLSEQDIHDLIINYYSRKKTIGNMIIEKPLQDKYYLVKINNTEYIMTLNDILYHYHNSDSFEPIPKTKVDIQIKIERRIFPYYSVTINNNTIIMTYWDLIRRHKENNFGLCAKAEKKTTEGEQ